MCRYGPFWIATTLVALSGVIGNYEITKVGTFAPHWSCRCSCCLPDHVLTMAEPAQTQPGNEPVQVLRLCACCRQVGASAALFYGYVGVFGVILWGLFKWVFKTPVGLTQVWCTYGEAWFCHKPWHRHKHISGQRYLLGEVHHAGQDSESIAAAYQLALPCCALHGI